MVFYNLRGIRIYPAYKESHKNVPVQVHQYKSSYNLIWGEGLIGSSVEFLRRWRIWIKRRRRQVPGRRWNVQNHLKQYKPTGPQHTRPTASKEGTGSGDSGLQSVLLRSLFIWKILNFFRFRFCGVDSFVTVLSFYFISLKTLTSEKK